MRLIIAGSRGFNDPELMERKLENILSDKVPECVVSGTARGADRLGENWALDHDIHVVQMPANWEEDGKAAGYRRNERMATYATHLVAFHDGESRGTQHMINLARREGLEVRIVRYSV